MGIYTCAYIPHQVRFMDIVDVISILLGAPKNCNFKISYSGKLSGSCIVKNVSKILYKSSKLFMASYVSFGINTPLGRELGSISFSFEGEYGPYTEYGSSFYAKVLYHRKCELWEIVARRLVEFFGGVLDINDSDGQSFDLQVQSPVWICANSGLPYRTLEKAKYELKPIVYRINGDGNDCP